MSGITRPVSRVGHGAIHPLSVQSGCRPVIERSTTDVLLETLREVAGGRFHLTVDELRRATALIRKDVRRFRPRGPKVLTSREREVLRKFCRGLSYTEIATADGVSRSNVRNTIYRIHDKTGVGSNQEMVGLGGAVRPAGGRRTCTVTAGRGNFRRQRPSPSNPGRPVPSSSA